jgi:hypothetical protein
MTGVFIAFGAVGWLLVVVLSIGLAQAAACSDRMLGRQAALAKRERPAMRRAA